MSDGLTVHVRINDAATGKPTPARVSFLAAGRYHAPFGRLEAPGDLGPPGDTGGHLLLGGERLYAIDGTCEVQLPPGEVVVSISRGPEYSPVHRAVVLGPGQISLRLEIERLANLREAGWFSGDTHVLFLTPHSALLEGAAEDVAVINLLAAHCFASLPNLTAWSGSVPALQLPGHMVVVNTLNRHPTLGSLGLLNAHRPVYPLAFGGDYGPDDWTLADWCNQCHRRKTGLVVWADPRKFASGEWVENRLSGEALANLVLGRIDAFEITPSPLWEADLAAWYTLLDAGFRVPLVGGSGKSSLGVAVGALRTYARLPEGEQLTYPAWIEAVRAGKTFVTNGPLLRLRVNGQEPGSALQLQADQLVTVQAEVRGNVPIERLEILLHGRVAASKEAAADRLATALEASFPASRSGWLAARCWGSERLADDQLPWAQTSPVYLEVASRPAPRNPEAIETLIGSLRRGLAWVATAARCTDAQRQRLGQVFHEALEALTGKA